MIETKALSVEVKDAAKGTVRAVFATTGVVDFDGDWTLPGAFGDQKVAMSPFGHSWREGRPPIGKGSVHEEGDRAIGELKVFMGSEAAREQFEVIKEMGDLLEWSYAFTVLETGDVTAELRQKGVFRVLKKLKVHEVSPVLIGAGVGTGTLSAKHSPGCGAAQAAIHAEYDRLVEISRKSRQPYIEMRPPTGIAWRECVAWACDQLNIPPSRTPTVLFYCPKSDGVLSDRTGWFEGSETGDGPLGTIYVDRRLSESEAYGTVVHESGHAFEYWRNPMLSFSEEWAVGLEKRLLPKWLEFWRQNR